MNMERIINLGQRLLGSIGILPQKKSIPSNMPARLHSNRQARKDVLQKLERQEKLDNGTVSSYYLQLLFSLRLLETDLHKIYTQLRSCGVGTDRQVEEIVGRLCDVNKRISDAKRDFRLEPASPVSSFKSDYVDLHAMLLLDEINAKINPQEAPPRAEAEVDFYELYRGREAAPVKAVETREYSMQETFEEDAITRLQTAYRNIENKGAFMLELMRIMVDDGVPVTVTDLCESAEELQATAALYLLNYADQIIARSGSDSSLLPMLETLTALRDENRVVEAYYSSPQKTELQRFIWEQYGVEQITPRYLLEHASAFAAMLANRYDAQYPGLRYGLVAELVGMSIEQSTRSLGGGMQGPVATMEMVREELRNERDIMNLQGDAARQPIEKDLSPENREQAIVEIQALLDTIPNPQYPSLINFLMQQRVPYRVLSGSSRDKAEYLLDNVVDLARIMDAGGEDYPRARQLYFQDDGLLARILQIRGEHQTEIIAECAPEVRNDYFNYSGQWSDAA